LAARETGAGTSRNFPLASRDSGTFFSELRICLLFDVWYAGAQEPDRAENFRRRKKTAKIMGYYNLEIRGSFKYPFEALTEQICPQCLCFGTLYRNPI
jgi:hypothetical protein